MIRIEEPRDLAHEDIRKYDKMYNEFPGFEEVIEDMIKVYKMKSNKLDNVIIEMIGLKYNISEDDKKMLLNDYPKIIFDMIMNCILDFFRR